MRYTPSPHGRELKSRSADETRFLRFRARHLPYSAAFIQIGKFKERLYYISVAPKNGPCPYIIKNYY